MPSDAISVATRTYDDPAGTLGKLLRQTGPRRGAPMLTGSASVAFSNGDPPLLLNAIGNGNWEATWVPQQPLANAATLTLSAALPADDIAAIAQMSIQAASNPGVV